jgi:hypothetical protein
VGSVQTNPEPRAGGLEELAMQVWIGFKARMPSCAYRKSDSAILVMKAAEDRLGCDDTEALNRPMEWSILVQRAMNARFIQHEEVDCRDTIA